MFEKLWYNMPSSDKEDGINMEDQQVSTLVPVPTKEGYFCEEDGTKVKLHRLSKAHRKVEVSRVGPSGPKR